jgi:CrcB protein
MDRALGDENMVMNLLIVSGCGGIGCVLRVMVRDALMRSGTRPWWAVMVINLFGALIMGALVGGAQSIEPHIGTLPVLGMTAVLAGWTTYSAFAMDVVQLWLRGEQRSACALWFITLCGAPLMALAGSAMMMAWTEASS